MNIATNNIFRTIALLLCVALPFNQSAFAAQAPQAVPATAPTPQQPAPVPSQIAAAHNIFLVNTGADPNFPLDSGQAYTDVYTALKSWGHFQLVNSPEQADLVFNLHDVAPISGIYGDNRTGVRSYTSPAFQLTIADPRSNTPLWTITSPVNITGRNATRARWNAIAITNLVSRVKVLVNQPLSATESADLTTAPNSHGTRNALLLAGGAAALVVGITFIVRNHMKNSQDAFCRANNIPLNECAGG